MFNIEKTATAILNKLAEDGSSCVEITLKSGELISIETGYNTSQQIRWYKLWSAGWHFCSKANTDIMEIAKLVCDYPNVLAKWIKDEDEWKRNALFEIHKYFDKYFNGKSVEEINANSELLDKAYDEGKRGAELPDVGDWSFYSDWHKDVFGYRPHGVVCGTYVSPY